MTRKTKIVFSGRIISLELQHARLPNGSELEMEIIQHPGGAAVVAIDESLRVCLLRQYRHALRAWLWELPAGKIDNAENPLETAIRELAEEAGTRADNWRSLGEIISSPGVFTEVIHLYLATGLHEVPSQAEEHEVFEVHWLPFEQAVSCAEQGEYTDAKTVAALLRARACLAVSST